MQCMDTHQLPIQDRAKAVVCMHVAQSDRQAFGQPRPFDKLTTWRQKGHYEIPRENYRVKEYKCVYHYHGWMDLNRHVCI